MLRSLGLLLLCPAGCTLPGACVTADLTKWCYHSDSARGPDVPAGAVPCPTPSSDGAVEDADDAGILRSGSGFGYTGLNHYFDADTGEHIATQYWTDVSIYCGGASYWYGTRLD